MKRMACTIYGFVAMLGLTASAVSAAYAQTGSGNQSIDQSIDQNKKESETGLSKSLGQSTDELPSPDLVTIQAKNARSEVSLNGARIQANFPGENPLKALHRLAAVNFQSADPWGNNEQNFSLFVHGFSAQQLGYTLDGVPLGDQQYGNYNGLSPQRAIISENIARVLFASGTGDLATASTSNLGGTIESYSFDPAMRQGWRFAQSIGSNATSRTYLRYDSGRQTDDAFYVSLLRQRAKAWDFDAVQAGDQINLKWIRQTESGKLSAYANFSDKVEPNEDSVVHVKNNDAAPYTRTFSYPDFDFASRYLGANGQPPASDGPNYRNYFGVAQRRDFLTYLKYETDLADNLSWINQWYFHHDQGYGAVAGPIAVAGLPALFKVYYPLDNLKTVFGDSGYAVRTTEYLINRQGLLSTLRQEQGAHQWQLGLWWEHNQSSAFRRWYALDVSAFRRWYALDVQHPLAVDERPRDLRITQYGSVIDNQVVQLHAQDEWRLQPDLLLQIGAKSSLQFAQGSFPVQPAPGAISGGSMALPEGRIDTKKWFLPQFGAVWDVHQESQVFFNLQKNLRQFITYGAVGASPWSLSNQAAFDLFKRTAEPETAWTTEIGLRGKHQFADASATSETSDTPEFARLRSIETQFTVYRVEFRDRLMQISPTPVISNIVNGNPILANVGSVHTRGVDWVANLNFVRGWSISNALSFNQSLYGADYQSGFTTFATKAKQVPASPMWMNKTSLLARWKTFEWQVSIDYLGKRYATYTNDLSVPASLLTDLAIQTTLPAASLGLREASISLHVQNLQNRRGISTLVVGAATNTYNSFPIPPRQIFLSFNGSW